MKYAHPLMIAAFAAIPYGLVTWGYTAFTDGDVQAFWVALGVLLGIRLFVSLIEMLGSVLSWRLYGRRIALGNAIKFLKANGFPPREYEHDSLLAYLARIQDGPEYASPLRAAAVETERLLTFIEQLGIVMGARTWEVWCAALDIYAPRSRATRHL
jgi:hypothetical protein